MRRSVEEVRVVPIDWSMLIPLVIVFALGYAFGMGHALPFLESPATQEEEPAMMPEDLERMAQWHACR